MEVTLGELVQRAEQVDDNSDEGEEEPEQAGVIVKGSIMKAMEGCLCHLLSHLNEANLYHVHACYPDSLVIVCKYVSVGARVGEVK